MAAVILGEFCGLVVQNSTEDLNTDEDGNERIEADQSLLDRSASIRYFLSKSVSNVDLRAVERSSNLLYREAKDPSLRSG